ncbi:hypothetical protein BASA82_001228 [Batrachochytrium salamandrivorans]|nr:hypothetical protein BASA60_010422 [Batrachochytrium salamandrivorans]KAH9256742.1 hypothetical protein BASA81_005036 [Batrachochytrium salamandrivorans]KAH9259844.1 hypothetical protein BASA82_001228 [Batrachochytrium salamandrivorans]KAH9269132.1 hypothetical protein BASA83_008883 [Batrachochytrium salamandrivorans]
MDHLQQIVAANANSSALENLRGFLRTAPTSWVPGMSIRTYQLPNEDIISCVLWRDLFHITGTDIVRILAHRFECFGRRIVYAKKFEEGIFSDLRSLKPGVDATLEEPRSPFLKFLYEHGTIRTQKKQKVFFWFSVDHDSLFMDALERDLKRERSNQEPCTVSIVQSEPQESLQRALHHVAISPFNAIPRQQGGLAAHESPAYCAAALPIPMGPSHMDPGRTATTAYMGRSAVPPLSPHYDRRRDSRGRTSPELVTPSPELGMEASLSAQFDPSSAFSMAQSHVNHPLGFKGSPNISKPAAFQDFSIVSPDTLQGEANIGHGRSRSNSVEPRSQLICPYLTCGRHFKRQDQLRRHVRSHSNGGIDNHHMRQSSHGSQASYLDYSDTESVNSLPIRLSYGATISSTPNNTSIADMIQNYPQSSPLIMSTTPMMMKSSPLINNHNSPLLMGKAPMVMGHSSVMMHPHTSMLIDNDDSAHSGPVPSQSANGRAESPCSNAQGHNSGLLMESARSHEPSFINNYVLTSRPQQIQTMMPTAYQASGLSMEQIPHTPTTMLVSSIIHEPDSTNTNFGSNLLSFDPNEMLHPFETLSSNPLG